MKKIFYSIFLLTLTLTAQKVKHKTVTTLNYSVPKWYISNEYNSYTSKIYLPEKQIQIFTNNKFHSDLKRISYNYDFKESLYSILFSDISGLSRISDPNKITDRTLLIKAIIKDPRINITITKEDKPKVDYKGKRFETPHRYKYNFSFEIDFQVFDPTKNIVLFTENYKKNEDYSFSTNSINDKREVMFETEKEAINEAINFISTTSIIARIYDSIQFNLDNNSPFKPLVQFILIKQNIVFYKLSKENKYPLINEFNELTDLFISETKSIFDDLTNQNTNQNNQNFKDVLDHNDTQSNKTFQVPYVYAFSNQYFNNVIKFEIDNNNFIQKLNPNEEIQKELLWCSMMNLSYTYYSIGNIIKAEEYIEKAKLYENNKKNTESIESQISYLKNKKDKLSIFYENQNIKKDVNMIYLGYLKFFKIFE